MIKFIACDLDGTLLNEKKELPHDFDYVLDKLILMGIKFAVASGRQYETVFEQFKKYEDKIIFIVENGAMVKERGKRIICNPLDKHDAAEILQLLKDEPGLYSIACGVNGAFGEKENETHIQDVIMYYLNYKTVDDVVESSYSDDLLKIAVYDDDTSELHCYPLLKDYYETNNVLVSGEHWLDIMKNGVTKGSAIEHIQSLYGYKPEECMAFGDFMNDADMMRVCEESYAVENAHPDLKALCKYTTLSNAEEGVTRTIKKVIFGE